MDSGFINILQKLVDEQGKAALTDRTKGRAFLSDYTGNEYKKEKRQILLAIEEGMAKTIDETNDLEPCKKACIRDLNEDYSLDTNAAQDIINTLALVLRGDTTLTASPTAERAAAEKAAAEKAAAEKAEAERKAAVKKALAERDAADRTAAKQAAAANRAARKAARRSSSSGSPIFVIVDRDSGDGSEIIFGVIGAAIGLGVGSLIGGFIAVILGGAIGWYTGKEIGKNVYVNLLAVILALACGILIAFLAGWIGNGLRPDWSPTIARILFFPFMIAGAALFFIARSRGNTILLITLIALSIGGGIALTEPPFPFPLTKSEPAAANSTAAQTSVTATITSNVNFRRGPSTTNEIIRQLQQGDAVTLTGETSGGWTQIQHNSDTGWVSSEFLTQAESGLGFPITFMGTWKPETSEWTGGSITFTATKVIISYNDYNLINASGDVYSVNDGFKTLPLTLKLVNGKLELTEGRYGQMDGTWSKQQ
jgi:uncharacterized protein YraI